MNPDEITDIETLKRWLNGRLRFQAQFIATRAVLRVFPLWSRLVNSPKYPGVHLTDLPVIHHLILSGVAAVFPEPVFWRAASEATIHHFARHAVESARTVAFAANSLVDFAAAARSKDDLFDVNDKFSTESFSAVSGAIAAADKFASGGHDIWEQIREDVRAIMRGDNPFSLPLWSIPQPDWFRQADAEGTAIGVRNAPGFLSRWWDGILSGEQLSWDLQREVALLPNPDSWLDLAHIAAVTSQIESRVLLDQTIRDNPYALTVVYDIASSKLVTLASESLSLDRINAALSRVLDDFVKRCRADKTKNQLGRSILEATKLLLSDLKRDQKRYAAEPLFLFDALSDAVNELRSIRELEGFGGVPLFDRLTNGIERNCDDICAASPAVLETQKNRAAVQLDRFTHNQLALAVEISRGMQGDSSGLLFAASGLAIRVLSDPKSSDDERKSAWYFVRAVVPRGARAMLDHKADSDDTVSSSAFGKGVDTAIGVADGLDKLSSGLTAAQNIALVSGGWVAAAAQFIQSTG